MLQAKQEARGFTLLELLIVIAIIAILSVILILILNPAETLKKSRDSQRISDLNTIKTALGLYLTSTSSPQLDNSSGMAACIGGAAPKLYISAANNTATPGGVFTGGVNSSATTTVDGTGWIPVNLYSLTGGSPISNFPTDPLNTYAAAASLANTDSIYRYACKKSPLAFEVDSVMESQAFTSETNVGLKDGGNNTTLYEVGSDLTLIP